MPYRTHSADLLWAAAGILFLIIRQFTWRPLTTANLFAIPSVLIGSGVTWIACGGPSSQPLNRWTLLAVGVEGLAAMLTGLAMGWLTQFRTRANREWYRLAPKGVALWALFVGIRVGSLYWFNLMGTPGIAVPGGLLVLFGLNRLVSGLTIKRRLRQQPIN
jgi:hypothetical protein